MKNLWQKEFSPIEIESPKKILKEQGEYLSEITGGLIVAKANGYDGTIHSGTIHGLSSLALNLGDREYNVQDDLGDIQEGTFKYEFYIASPKAPDYKYRVMFIEHNISLYPVNIVLDQEIATEINVNEEVVCENVNEFEAILTSILNSSKIEKIINALLSINDVE